MAFASNFMAFFFSSPLSKLSNFIGSTFIIELKSSYQIPSGSRSHFSPGLLGEPLIVVHSRQHSIIHLVLSVISLFKTFNGHSLPSK